MYPIALSSGIFFIIEKAITESKGKIDFERIVYSLLIDLFFDIKLSKGDTSIIYFTVKIGKKNHKLYSVCDGGDDGKPVITIMLTSED